MYKTEKDIQDRIKEHFNNVIQKSPTLECVAICAQGSMNYGLMYEDSDVDTKMLVLPNLKQLVLNEKPINKTYIIDPTEEHCDCKDIRDYFKIFRKQNINFVEILFTKYSIINPKYADIWNELLSKREELVRMNEYAAISCIKGMAIQKREALCHPYPSKLEILEKYGYDCYSDDTLFLTNNGWKTYYDITPNDLLGTVNPNNLELEFQPFLNRVEKTVDTTYTIESWYSKFEITENHNLFCSELSRNKNGIEYNPKLANWHLDCLKNNFKIRRGYSKDKHILSFPYNNKLDNLSYSDDFLYFLGAVISEGTFVFRDNKIKEVRTTQTNHGKREFFEVLDSLNSLKLKKYTYKREDKECEETIWCSSNDFIKEQCYQICGHGAKNKKIDSNFLLSLSKRQCRLILKTMLLGDGSKDKDSPRWIYYTSSLQLSLDTLLLAHLAGYEANILGGIDGYYYEDGSSQFGNVPMYQISIREKEINPHHINLSLTAKANSNIIKNNKITKVVCFEVPNGTLVTMKDGKTACQGNCKQLHHLVRLWYFLQDYIDGKPYSECLIPAPDIRDELLSIKTNSIGYDVNDATDIADYYTEIICNKADSYRDNLENKINPEMDKFLDKILYKLMVRYLGKELEWLST